MLNGKSVTEYLETLSKSNGHDVFSSEFAKVLDSQDKLGRYRGKFIIPKLADFPSVDLKETPDPKGEIIYLCGHSLGLQPKRLKHDMEHLLDTWGKYAVNGHFHGVYPWAFIDEYAQRPVAELVGALPDEVAVMNSLTVNLHLLLVSFYRPTAQRYKILLEDRAFPSDHYAFESRVRQHGYEPKDALLMVSPREGEHYLRTEDIVKVIKEHGDEIQLVCFPGVHFFTGQRFDIPTITKAGHEVGAYVGFDLAHAVGNVEIKLHDWDVDFAIWCHYKYMSGGGGAAGGAFLHQKHAKSDLPRLQGWWGHHMASRFVMDNKMDSSPGISGYRLSCPSVLGSFPVKVGAELMVEAGIERLTKKSRLLTGYLEYLLTNELKNNDGTLKLEILTPRNPEERGSMLSVKFKESVAHVYEKLAKRGIVCDFRMPDTLRLAPLAINNSFMDIYRFVANLKDIMDD